jgi:hypothetical protein
LDSSGADLDERADEMIPAFNFQDPDKAISLSILGLEFIDNSDGQTYGYYFSYLSRGEAMSCCRSAMGMAPSMKGVQFKTTNNRKVYNEIAYSCEFLFCFRYSVLCYG